MCRRWEVLGDKFYAETHRSAFYCVCLYCVLCASLWVSLQCCHDLRLSTHTHATLIRMSLQATWFSDEVSARTKVCELVQWEFQCLASIPKHLEPPDGGLWHVVSKKYCFFLTLFMFTYGSTVTSLPEMSVALVLLPTQTLTLSHTEYTPRCWGCLRVLLLTPCPPAGSASGGCELKSTLGERWRRLLKSLGSTVGMEVGWSCCAVVTLHKTPMMGVTAWALKMRNRTSMDDLMGTRSKITNEKSKNNCYNTIKKHPNKRRNSFSYVVVKNTVVLVVCRYFTETSVVINSCHPLTVFCACFLPTLMDLKPLCVHQFIYCLVLGKTSPSE